MLGLDPVAYLEADATTETVLDAVMAEAVDILADWREDLAVRVANQVWSRVKMK